MGVKMDILSLKDYFRLVKFLNRLNIFSHILPMDKQQFQTLEKPNQKLHSKITRKSRLFFVLFFISSLTIFFITNSFFNLRFTEITKREGQLNLTKNASNIVNELQKNSIIAQLLANDQEITKALISEDFSLLSDKFARFIADISVASITLLDKNGNLIASTAKENFEKKKYYTKFFRIMTIMNLKQLCEYTEKKLMILVFFILDK